MGGERKLKAQIGGRELSAVSFQRSAGGGKEREREVAEGAEVRGGEKTIEDLRFQRVGNAEFETANAMRLVCVCFADRG